jgi:exodeoxyribonuclease VII small subunit
MTGSPAPWVPGSLSADLQRLEHIVRQLESDDTDLDQALLLFEEGIAKLRAARERLADAELRIQRVLEDAAGQLRVEELDE